MKNEDYLNEWVRLPCDFGCGHAVTVHRKVVPMITIHGIHDQIVETYREPCRNCDPGTEQTNI